MSDRKKIENLFSFLRENYILLPSHTNIGEVRMYVDSSDLERTTEDGEITPPDNVEMAYFQISVKGIEVQHTASGMGLVLQHDLEKDFIDVDLNRFIIEVKKNFRIFGAKKKLVKKVVKKTVKAKKVTKKYIVVDGVRYYAK